MTDTITTATDPAIGELVKIIELDHSVERVWRAVTDPAEVVLWFPTKTAQWELTPGSVGTMAWHGSDGGDDPTDEVHIEKVQPPTYFAYTWGYSAADKPVTLVEFTLAPAAAGGTQLTVRESGFLAPEHRGENNGGWDAELAELVEYLSGTATA